ncbi:unnamed protein product [Clonostachys rosea]|uniref:Zn(2)-C6 fungal-type domain-containing protein n=1 Tax=Bionectria ochroleuca TaxID=29856 RepID=A0ABY6V3S8_BIOOC|nr:unnamed protein product [Clonostachys rosea]
MSQPSATDSGTALQSIRSSCDRCRFHKLKCNVQAESDGQVPCERCMRAKVPCVFGRRRRANRSSDERNRQGQAAQQQQQQQPEQSPVVAPVAIPTPMSTSAPSSSLGRNRSISSAPQMIEPSDGKQKYSSPIWGGVTIGLADDAGSMPGGDMDWEKLHHNLRSDEGCMFDTESLDLTSWSPSAPFLPLLNLATDFQVVPGSSARMSSWAPAQQLLSLISEMQQCLGSLERGAWQGDCARGLDDYPVGTILHLSREFGAIASPLLGKASTTGIIRASVTGVEVPEGGVDTAAALFVLGGYMWLMRIYSVVLGHFQSHLSRYSYSSSGLSDRGASSNVSPTLQLGELPSANTAHDLGRIHTALSMLLGALREVEEYSGQGGAVVRNLVVALLTLPSVGEFDDSVGLVGKVQSIKELLREKMGL